MDPQINVLVVIIVVVTVALFLVGLVWRLYHGGNYDAARGGYDKRLD
jgi:hypothetical protein